MSGLSTANAVVITDRIERLSYQASGLECPDCDAHHSQIVDNGERGSLRSFCCTVCGVHWDRSVKMDEMMRLQAGGRP